MWIEIMKKYYTSGLLKVEERPCPVQKTDLELEQEHIDASLSTIKLGLNMASSISVELTFSS